MSNTHSTLLLCSESERNLDELEPLCRNSSECTYLTRCLCLCVIITVSVVEQCVGGCGSVLAGGGCTDTSLAHYIRSKVKDVR